MRRFLLTLVLLLSPILVWAQPITNPLSAVDAVVKIYNRISEGESYQCTAFAVRERTYLTAAHCVEDTEEVYTMAGSMLQVVARDPENDLAALKSRGLNLPYLRIGSLPKIGTKVFAIGFGGDLSRPLFYSTEIVDAGITENVDGLLSDKLIMLYNAISGMSGGPVINAKGEVVSIEQMSNGQFMAGTTTPILKQFVESIPK